MQLNDEQKKLVEDNIKFMFSKAHWYFKNYGKMEFDDIASVCSIAMCKAAYHYNPNKGVKFLSFAGQCIDNELKMNYRGEKNRIKNNFDIYLKDDDDDEFISKIKDINNDIDVLLIKLSLQKVFKKLNKKEKRIFHLYITLGLKRKEISKVISRSQPQCSRLVSSLLNKIREEIYETKKENNCKK